MLDDAVQSAQTGDEPRGMVYTEAVDQALRKRSRESVAPRPLECDRLTLKTAVQLFLRESPTARIVAAYFA